MYLRDGVFCYQQPWTRRAAEGHTPRTLSRCLCVCVYLVSEIKMADKYRLKMDLAASCSFPHPFQLCSTGVDQIFNKATKR